MNLTVDIGNSQVKRAWFDGDRMLHEPGTDCPWRAERAIVCASGRCDVASLALPAERVMLLTAETALPITLDYATPETLGPDRIAAACGAWKVGEGSPAVIVDAGTCITVDYLDGTGTYRGGAILPGMGINFRALHTFTAKLPLLNIGDITSVPVTGRSTAECMTAGVVAAARYAVAGFVAHYRSEEPGTQVMLTGGDAALLWGHGALQAEGGRIEPNLVMIGLNEILKTNEK